MPVHGIVVERLTGGVRAVETPNAATIGIMASAAGADEGELILLRTPEDLTNIDDGTGSVTPIMNAIRKHSTAPVVLNVVNEENLENAVGNAATFTRAYRFLQAEAELGVRPRLLPQALVGNVEDDLIAVADRLYAQALLDGPNTTDAEAINAVGGYDSIRAAFYDPAFVDDSDNVLGSSILHAAIASTLNFWEPVSNKAVLGVKNLSRSIGFTMGDPSCQAQLLNDENISTIIRKNGWRLWGGLSLSTDPQFKFLNVGRTDDIIVEAIQESFLWAVDQGITKNFVDSVLESVNAFLRDLKVRGAIIGGEAWVDADLNTETSIADGNIYFDYEFTPVYQAYTVTMRRHITNKYLSTIFGT